MPDAAPPEPGPSAGRRRRDWRRPVLLVVLPGLALVIGLYWYATSGRYEDDERTGAWKMWDEAGNVITSPDDVELPTIEVEY